MMLEIVQIIFFCVSTVGVIIATINHFFFVKDRNAQTLISLTELFESAHDKYLSDLKDDQHTKAPTVQYLNVVTIYCHMHNHNQLRPKTKVVHECFVADRLSLISKRNLLRKTNQPLNLFSSSNYKEIGGFINRNRELFADFESVKDYFSEEPS